MTTHPRPQLIPFGQLEVFLPEDHPDTAARAALEGQTADDVAGQFPASSLAWAVLAEAALFGATSAKEAGSGKPNPVAAYAYARTGYHRGLDSLRRAGWKGQGLIPAGHEQNQGFLRALLALAEAARAIGETDEAERCEEFIANSGTSPEEISALR